LRGAATFHVLIAVTSCPEHVAASSLFQFWRASLRFSGSCRWAFVRVGLTTRTAHFSSA